MNKLHKNENTRKLIYLFFYVRWSNKHISLKKVIKCPAHMVFIRLFIYYSFGNHDSGTALCVLAGAVSYKQKSWVKTKEIELV